MSDKERPFIVMTDANNVATEAVLMQNAGGGLQPEELRSTLGRYWVDDGINMEKTSPTGRWRIRVPIDPGIRSDALREAHDSPAGGHMGRDMTLWW